ncbi:MAG: orotidine-5'-phosphate decarboxylase [Anaerovoracaceae bacterium]
MKRDVIIALDFPGKKETMEFLDEFNDRRLYVKVGMELFYSQGPSIIKEIKNRGHKIFLDLKLHDIPNTVQSAMKALGNLDIDMVNVHAAGTKKMMEAAILGLTKENGERPLLIAVTQLTSTDQERLKNDILIDRKLEDVVVKYAQNAMEAGLDGVVCSPLESPLIHENCDERFLTVTPGVRFADSNVGDQVRVTTPARAKELGSNFIVVGRPITQADDVVAAYDRCVKEFV